MKYNIAIIILSATTYILAALAPLRRSRMGAIRNEMSKVWAIIPNLILCLLGGFCWFAAISLFPNNYSGNDIAGILFLFVFTYIPSLSGISGIIGVIFERRGITFYSDSYGSNINYRKTWDEIVGNDQ